MFRLFGLAADQNDVGADLIALVRVGIFDLAVGIEPDRAGRKLLGRGGNRAPTAAVAIFDFDDQIRRCLRIALFRFRHKISLVLVQLVIGQLKIKYKTSRRFPQLLFALMIKQRWWAKEAKAEEKFQKGNKNGEVGPAREIFLKSKMNSIVFNFGSVC